jgi:hypothetical protein
MTGMAADATPTPPTRNCVTCGRTRAGQVNGGPYCGHDYRFVAGPPAKTKSSKPTIGGILIVIAGILAIAMGILYIVIEPHDLESWGYSPINEADLSLADLEEILGMCGVVELIFGLVAIIGGIFAIMRRSFGLSIIGGIFGLIGIGFFIGSLLGLIGLILVAISKDEF